MPEAIEDVEIGVEKPETLTFVQENTLMALFIVVRSGPEVEELGQGHQVPGLTVQEVEVFMSNLKGRGEDAQEWADIDALGVEGTPARWQRARILGRSKDQ